MAHVPAVGRYRQIVGVEDRDLDSAHLDRRAPVGSLYVAIRTSARVPAETVCLFQAARAALLVLDAVGDDEQHFLRRVAGFIGAVPRGGDVSRLAELAQRIIVVGSDVAARRSRAR